MGYKVSVVYRWAIELHISLLKQNSNFRRKAKIVEGNQKFKEGNQKKKKKI